MIGENPRRAEAAKSRGSREAWRVAGRMASKCVRRCAEQYATARLVDGAASRVADAAKNPLSERN